MAMIEIPIVNHFAHFQACCVCDWSTRKMWPKDGQQMPSVTCVVCTRAQRKRDKEDRIFMLKERAAKYDRSRERDSHYS